MRNPKVSPQASKIFSSLTDKQIAAYIDEYIRANSNKILRVVSTNEKLKSLIEARIEYMLHWADDIKTQPDVYVDIWVNANPFKNSVKETKAPEYLAAVQAGLNDFFKNGHLAAVQTGLNKFLPKTMSPSEIVSALLVKFNAKISGGFILKSIGKFIDPLSVDIDCYVPTANQPAFIKLIEELFVPTSHIKHVASGSPSSFFKKNGIKSVTKFSRGIAGTPSYAEMDVVEVAEDRTPTNVIKNFDLTFCENWYDGKSVYLAYPEHVEHKSGFLENHYLDLYFGGNEVLRKRIAKYMRRGFTVSYINPINNKISTIKKSDVANINAAFSKPNSTRGATKKFRTIGPIDSSLVKERIDRVEKLPFNYKKNRLASAELFTEATSPIDPSSFNAMERSCVKYFTQTGSSLLNRYLYSYITVNEISWIQTPILKAIAERFPIKDESINLYGMKILYYYFINLYNTIQRGPSAKAPFAVYRGSKTAYLSIDSTKYYYLNSFASTTYLESVASNFSGGAVGKKYMFLMSPDCNYMNISILSSYRREAEVLLNPYHRVLYIDTTASGWERYAILPCDIPIPDTFEEFTHWKAGVSAMSVSATTQTGGRNANTISMINSIKNHQNSRTLYNKKLNNRRTRKINTITPRNYTMSAKSLGEMDYGLSTTTATPPSVAAPTMNVSSTVLDVAASAVNAISPEFIKRLTAPIPCFPGKAPTKAELDYISHMVTLFDKK